MSTITTGSITTNNGGLPLRSPATITTTTTVNNRKIVVRATAYVPTTTFTLTTTQEPISTAPTAATAAATNGVDSSEELMQILPRPRQRNPSPAYIHELISGGSDSNLTPPSPPTSPFAPPSTPPFSPDTTTITIPPTILPNSNVNYENNLDSANQAIPTSSLSNSGGTIRTNPDSEITNDHTDKKLKTDD